MGKSRVVVFFFAVGTSSEAWDGSVGLALLSARLLAASILHLRDLNTYILHFYYTALTKLLESLKILIIYLFNLSFFTLLHLLLYTYNILLTLTWSQSQKDLIICITNITLKRLQPSAHLAQSFSLFLILPNHINLIIL